MRVIRCKTRRSRGKSYIASFAPVVFEALDLNDSDAKKIVRNNAQVVADRISLAKNTWGEFSEIVCAGGLFSASAFYDELSARVDIPLTIPDVSPAVGACRRALELS